MLLVYRGAVLTDRLRRQGVSPGDLDQAIREHGIADLTGVESAVLEMDGSISVIAKRPTAGTRP